MMTTSALTVVDIASYVSAGTLATSRLLVACKPLWDRCPQWLAVALPVLALDLPQVGAAFMGVTTSMDLLTAVTTSLALVLPGLAAAEKPTN